MRITVEVEDGQVGVRIGKTFEGIGWESFFLTAEEWGQMWINASALARQMQDRRVELLRSRVASMEQQEQGLANDLAKARAQLRLIDAEVAPQPTKPTHIIPAVQPPA